MASSNQVHSITQLSLEIEAGIQQVRRQVLHPLTEGFQLQYSHSHGQLYQGDSINWLESLESESIDLVFADPPYNINKADWDKFENQEQYIEWSLRWINEASRILKTTGSLYICGFSEILADLKHPASKYFKSYRWLIWHYKNKGNLGSDWGVPMKVLFIFVNLIILD